MGVLGRAEVDLDLAVARLDHDRLVAGLDLDRDRGAIGLLVGQRQGDQLADDVCLLILRAE